MNAVWEGGTVVELVIFAILLASHGHVQLVGNIYCLCKSKIQLRDYTCSVVVLVVVETGLSEGLNHVV